MSRSEPPPVPPSRTPIGAGLLVAGLIAIGAGLLVPQLLGSFSDRDRLILALIEVGLPRRCSRSASWSWRGACTPTRRRSGSWRAATS